MNPTVTFLELIQYCLVVFELGKLLMTVLSPQVQDQRAVRSDSLCTISVTYFL